jgi:hypothetical protein
MAGTDPVDTHGHDKDNATAEYPNLDTTDANAASQVDWANGDTPASDMVLAQTPAEVQAQIDNEPAGS